MKGLVKMKLTKKCIAMLAAFAVCVFCTGGIPLFGYFTYHISKYAEYPNLFAHSFVGYLAVFMMLACGFFEIYDINRLALIFAAIQPVKLAIDFVTIAAFDLTGFYAFHPMLGLFLTYMAIYFADLLIGNRSGFAQTVRQNKKPLLMALVISVVFGVAAVISDFVIGTISNALFRSDDAEMIVKMSMLITVVMAVITVSLFIAGTLRLKAIIGKIYTPTAEGTAAAGTALTVAAIALIAAYTAYYLINLIQTYTSFFSETPVW